MSYEIDYNDKRFTEVTTEKNNALKESDKTYDQMITDSDKYFQQQTDALKEYGDKQTQLQQQQTDFAIEKVEQQKEQAHKDYLKEQSGAYVDWQKQSNRYGAKAEQQASVGLSNSGYSESSQVSMYNTYQNRVMTAREAYTRAVLNYDNAIKDAQLQNSSVLAEIAYNTLQKQLELSLQGFQYKNNLVLEKAKAKRELEDTYYQRYQNVLNQINTENALAEQIRQFNEQLAEEKRQFNESLEASSGSSGSGGGSSYSYSSGGSSSGSSSSGSSKITKTSGGSSSTSKSSGTTVSSKEKLALGKGPVSDNTVKNMVASGQASVKTNSNGKSTLVKTYQQPTTAQLVSNNLKLDGYNSVMNMKANAKKK